MFTWEGIPVAVTFHPSYVARNGGEKSKEFTEVVSDIIKSWRLANGEVLGKSSFEVVDILRG
jgi:uracil-DNA glycosylase